MKKKLISLILCATIVFSFGAPALALDRDVSWTADAVEKAAAGTWLPEGTPPETEMTRLDFCKLVWRALDRPLPDGSYPYSDADETGDYTAITVLHERGLLNGFPFERFEPDCPATREFVALILSCLAPQEFHDFRDMISDYADISEWARPAYSNALLVEITIDTNERSAAADKYMMYPRETILTGEAVYLLSFILDWAGSSAADFSLAAKGYYYIAFEVGGIEPPAGGDLDGIITRGEFAFVLWAHLAEENPEIEYPSDYYPFTDVPQDAYYRAAVTGLHAAEIVKGCGNELFAPDAPLTREMAMTMLSQISDGINEFGYGALSAYEDFEDISEWARTAYDSPLILEIGMVFNAETGREVEVPLAYPKEALSRCEACMFLLWFDEAGLLELD